MKKTFIFLLTIVFPPLLFPSLLTAQPDSIRTVNDIFSDSPKELKEKVLLIPRFDLMDPEEGVTGNRRTFIIEANKAAKRANSSLKETIDKSYSFEYKLVSLSEVESLKEEGYRYYMDMVLMPKQMETPKKEAMRPSFVRHSTANKMYQNNNLQFHYYFYVRDLETDDAYISSRLKGNADVYIGMKKFLSQVVSDIKN
ncbi:MAG: hypothetical protein SF052_13015 [Bacteroidia bacterium]|nr:hypothetical protein [Bacteroidia bacterium]